MDGLAKSEVAQLADCEATIEKGQKTFVEVGNALKTIRDSRLYRQSYSNFEDYCRERWGWTRMRASQLIESAAVTEEIVNHGLQLPGSERQARPLSKLPKEKRPQVWQEAVASAPKSESGAPKVTAKHVEAVVEKEINRSNPKPPKSESSPRKKQGDSLITATSRKAVIAAINVLERALDQIGYLERCEGPIEQIRRLIDA